METVSPETTARNSFITQKKAVCIFCHWKIFKYQSTDFEIFKYRVSQKDLNDKTRSREEYHITTDEIWRTVHSKTSQVYLERTKLLHNTTARWQAD
jgi:hypothetical protein